MLIDLDVVPAQPPRVRPTPSIRYVVVAVAVLVLLLLGGAAAPSPGGVARQVLKVDAQGLSAHLLTTEALYVARADGQVEATPLCDGCPAWSARITSGQRLALGGDDTLVVDANDAGVATVLDARTGAVLWSREGFSLVQVVGGRVAEWSPDDGTLRMRELRTGRLLWKRPASAFAGDERRMVVIDGARAAVYTAEDGRVVTGARELGVRGERDFAVPGVSAQIVGGRLVVFGGSYIASYRIDGLEREWVTPSVSPFAVAGCAGLLCAIGFPGLTVLEPATGRVRWSSPEWRLVTEAGVATNEDGRSARVDFATGRVEHEFGRGRPIDGLLFYPEGDRTTLLDAADGRVRGVIPRVTPDACSTAGDLLACLRYDSTVTVWRVTV